VAAPGGVAGPVEVANEVKVHEHTRIMSKNLAALVATYEIPEDAAIDMIRERTGGKKGRRSERREGKEKKK